MARLPAPTDKALLYDIELAKRAGFNVIRKHIKVEPQRLVLYCDRLGFDGSARYAESLGA